MDKEFQKIFDKLCYGRTPHSVWDDFIFMSAAAIFNGTAISNGMAMSDGEAVVDGTAVSDTQKRADKFAIISKNYSPDELKLIAQLFALTAVALEENPQQDYLGQLFMELNFGNVRAGQYFTPYHVAELMADLSMTSAKNHRYETVNDPACGSGVMLIATYNKMILLKRDPTTELFVVGQDIDCSIALMCYIQLSLLGAAGYVVVGDSLAQPLTGDPLFAPDGAWCTPMYYHWVWAWRRTIRQLEKLEEQ